MRDQSTWKCCNPSAPYHIKWNSPKTVSYKKTCVIVFPIFHQDPPIPPYEIRPCNNREIRPGIIVAPRLLILNENPMLDRRQNDGWTSSRCRFDVGFYAIMQSPQLYRTSDESTPCWRQYWSQLVSPGGHGLRHWPLIKAQQTKYLISKTGQGDINN